MEEINLNVLIRTESGKSAAKKIRREGFIPCIVYGGDEHGPTVIKTDRKMFERIARQHEGENVLYHLNVYEGDKKLRDYAAIVKEAQSNPVSEDILHIDFTRVNLKEDIEVDVQVVAKGEPVGIKKGGTLEHYLWELDVICLPTNIPQSIEVDVSGLDIQDNIHVRDLKLPAGVRTEHDPDAIVFAVEFATSEEDLEEEEGATAEVEVIKEKKKEADADGDKDK